MINFVNSFLSYLLLLLLIAVIAGCAIAIGITLRKKKNMSAESMAAAPVSEETQG